ncbi:MULTISPECIES: MFS transporter [Acidianus]|uniref:MFS transporter n=1 Tax=Candidatus Acidianus copahuensis TaxID=1160895 RepID=A0A031LRL2_9CREN|nr:MULTISPECIES: MFS transporter [Acidianus]EZQ07059.1 MFS transporter [Candidatus Acidianus copahuensis]NON61142.1 MFS transporter [Acidianus sp. RZ1]
MQGIPNLIAISRRKRMIRIIPIVFFLYLINFLDRVNISYAIDAGMFNFLGVPSKEADFIASIASSLFFVGYFIPQIFSNLGINRYGVRKIFTIAFTAWGLITIATGFVTSVPEVYVLRFLLGIAEGPFYAGVIFYLSLWFLKSERATANSLFNAAIPIAGIVGSIIAGSIFSFYGDYPGWRILFWYEGGLALVGAALAFFLLTDFPHQASWLSKDEKKALESAINEESAQKVKIKWTRSLKDRDVIILALVYFLGVTSLYGYSIWLPSIISSISGVSAAESSFLSAIPYVIASISLFFIATYSDKRQNHKITTFLVFIVAALGLAASAATVSIVVISFILFCIAAIGIFSFLSPFWAIPTKFLEGDSAAASIGLINAVGNLGGIVGPIVVGYLELITNSFVSGVYAMALFSLLAGLILLLVKREKIKTK